MSWIARALSGSPFSLSNSAIDPDRNGIQAEPLAAGTYSGNRRGRVHRRGLRRASGTAPAARASSSSTCASGITLQFGARRVEMFGEIFNVTNRNNFANPSGQPGGADRLPDSDGAVDEHQPPPAAARRALRVLTTSWEEEGRPTKVGALSSLLLMRVGPHPHALRLDSLRSLAAAAGAADRAARPHSNDSPARPTAVARLDSTCFARRCRFVERRATDHEPRTTVPEVILAVDGSRLPKPFSLRLSLSSPVRARPRLRRHHHGHSAAVAVGAQACHRRSERRRHAAEARHVCRADHRHCLRRRDLPLPHAENPDRGVARYRVRRA